MSRLKVNKTNFLYIHISSILIVAGICTAVLAYFDAYEWFYHHSRQHETYNYDEIVVFMTLFMVIGLLWVVLQLHKVTKTEIYNRKKAETHLSSLNQELEERINFRTAQLRHELDEHKQAETQLIKQQKQLSALSAKMSMVQEKERYRIAVDLHDHIGQSLAIVNIRLGMLGSHTTSDSNQQLLNDTRALIKDCICYSRTLVTELSCPLFCSITFPSAVECVAQQLLEKNDIDLQLKIKGELPQLPEHVQLSLFKAIQECLVNIVKHAKAHNVEISFRSDENSLVIGIQDDGIGFDVHSLDQTVPGDLRGFGVSINRDRLTNLNGNYSYTSKPGAGTHITLSVPVQKQQMGVAACR